MGLRSNKNKAYKVWKSMMTRCYHRHVHTHHPKYKDVKVCESWRDFNNFEIWFHDNYILGFSLDKDLLGDGKLYSPENCCFLPIELNTFINKKFRADKLLGVKYRPNNRFQSRVYYKGKEEVLGTFGSEEEAHKKYLKRKIEIVNMEADKYEEILSEKVIRKLRHLYKIK